MRQQKMKVTRYLIILAMILLSMSFPKAVVQAHDGFPEIDDGQQLYPDKAVGTITYRDLGEKTDQNALDIKITANIKGKKYEGKVTEVSQYHYKYEIDYPVQSSGTEISFTLSDGLGAEYSNSYEIEYYLKYELLVDEDDVFRSKLSGRIGDCDSVGDVETDGNRVSAFIGDKEYEGSIKGGKFTIKYPKQKLGTSVKIIVTNRYGACAGKKKVVIDNHPLKLKIDKID